jgi:hypothetical protein
MNIWNKKFIMQCLQFHQQEIEVQRTTWLFLDLRRVWEWMETISNKVFKHGEKQVMLVCVWNVMAHAQKQDFVFRRNGRDHLNRQGRQFSRLLAAEVCASTVVMLDTPSSEVVKGTGYPLHSSISTSLPLLCVTVCHHVSTGLYLQYVELPRLEANWNSGRKWWTVMRR